MHKKICILDYGLGNIKSLENALNKIGYNPVLYSANQNKSFDLIFIPGVGSYNKASELLLNERYLNFLNKINEKSKIFGICLGMQIFSSEGYENGRSQGLDYIKGQTKKIKINNQNNVLPFVGYFDVNFKINENYLKKFNNSKFYFVHSYEFVPINNANIMSTTTNQGITYCSSVFKDRFIGTQFHPEKSGDNGLEFLKATIKNIL